MGAYFLIAAQYVRRGDDLRHMYKDHSTVGHTKALGLPRGTYAWRRGVSCVVRPPTRPPFVLAYLLGLSALVLLLASDEAKPWAVWMSTYIETKGTRVAHVHVVQSLLSPESVAHAIETMDSQTIFYQQRS